MTTKINIYEMAAIAGSAHEPPHRDTAGMTMNYDEIPHMPLGTVPEDLPDENPGLYRLIIAKRAIIAGYEAGEEDPEASIGDLLADLRHLCDALGLDFGCLDDRAYGHYVAELEDEVALKSACIKGQGEMADKMRARIKALEDTLRDALERLDYLRPDRFDDKAHQENWDRFMTDAQKLLKGIAP